MKRGSIKKYLLPSLPYLFILWAFLKLGTACRLAAGADFAHKLMGLMQSIGPAFGDFSPGLNGFDWLLGIVGAVGAAHLHAHEKREEVSAGCRVWDGALGLGKRYKTFYRSRFQK